MPIKEDSIFFTVIPIDPVAWARTRGDGKVRFKAKHLRKYQEAIQLTVEDAYEGEPLSGPLAIGLTFIRKRPQKKPKMISKKAWGTGSMLFYPGVPDIDNLIKAILDAVNKTSLWHDDAQVVSVSATKNYAESNGSPRIVFTVAQLED